MSTYRITVTETVERNVYRGSYCGTETTRADILRLDQTVDALDLNRVIEAVNPSVKYQCDTPKSGSEA